MLRCALKCLAAVAAALVVALPAAAGRLFPPTALRGEFQVQQPPLVQINGTPWRLAPGARIRGEDNLIRLSGTLVGQRFVVNYTVDPSGLVKDVWILTGEERALRPWPTTAADAARWRFDPVTQTWSKP